MAPSILARLRKYVGDRRRSPRRGARFLTRIPVAVSPLDKGAGSAPALGAEVAGFTRDLGASGLTLGLAAVRVGGRYLTDNECNLGLPAGDVFLLARVVRFEPPLGPGGEYILGARILDAREGDRAAYYEFLKGLEPAERRAAERGRAQSEPTGPGAVGSGWQAGADAVSAGELRSAFENFIRLGAPGGRT
jgi:hypothetical protein